MSLSDAGSIQEFPVFSYSIRNLAYFDKLIGRMGAGRFAGTQFERWEVHQSLVAQRRTAEWLHAHGYAFSDKRMRRVDAG